MGIWLCEGCFKTHNLRSKFRHGKGFDFVSPPDCGDGVVRFVLYDIIKPYVPYSSEQLDHVDDLVQVQHEGFTLALINNLFSKGLRTVKSIIPKCRLGFSRVLKEAVDKVICTPDDISCWVSLLFLPLCLLKTFRPRSNLECKLAIKRQRQEESIEDIDLGEQNIKQCKRKICDGHYTAAVRVLSSSGVAPYNDATLEELKTKHPFKPPPLLPHISIDHHHLVASQAVVLERIKSFSRGTSCGRDGLRAQHLIDCLSRAAIAIYDGLVSSITQVVNLFLDGKCLNILGERSSVRCWGGGGSEAILHFMNRLIEACGDDVGLSMLLVDFKNAFNLVDREVMLREVRLRFPAISRWVEFCYSNPTRLYYGEHTLWSCQGVQQGDPLGPLLFSLVLHPLICKIRDSFSLSLHAWYLDDSTIIGDTMVVGKVLELIVEDGPGCGLHLNVDKTKVFWPKEDPRSRLAGIFPPNIARPLHGAKLLGGPASVDFHFCNEFVMKRVAKTIGLMDAIAKINDSQCELLLFCSCAGISRLYFTMCTCPPCVFESAQRSFEVALCSSLEHTSAGLQTKLLRHTGIVFPGPIFDDALSVFNTSMDIDLLSSPKRIIPLSGLGWSLFLACSRIFAEDIYGDHVVSCVGIIGIKHRHNVVRDTLVDICYRSGISAGKEDGGLDVCVDLTGSLPLTQTGMVDFVPGRVVIDVAQRKREADAVTLLKRIWKFFMA
uniref:Reverse transcriptase domain-containing protein n=1 Tax=Tanacetum cinerariifolium TaxID=118510 RepID=A0A699IJI8_TANCI|nr:hypothetical protein [Tanacetum cinerariifolium]